MAPTRLEVTFTYHVERDPSYWALPVPVELRALVTLGVDDRTDDPIVEPLDKAVWEDALGPEIVFSAQRSEFWVGAEEAAVDAACERLSRQATRESNAMAVAS